MPEGDQAQRESELLKQLLALREIPCPVCGYNLRAIESDKCPECGAKLDLRVGSSDLKLGLWIAAILAIALPLGFATIWAALFCYFWIVKGNYDSGEWIATGSLLLLALIEGFALGVLVRIRKRFWTMRKQTQCLGCVPQVSGPASSPNRGCRQRPKNANSDSHSRPSQRVLGLTGHDLVAAACIVISIVLVIVVSGIVIKFD